MSDKIMITDAMKSVYKIYFAYFVICLEYLNHRTGKEKYLNCDVPDSIDRYNRFMNSLQSIASIITRASISSLEFQ